MHVKIEVTSKETMVSSGASVKSKTLLGESLEFRLKLVHPKDKTPRQKLKNVVKPKYPV